MMRSFWARTESRSACRPRSASNSSTSRYDKEKRRYQPTARRLTSGSNCLHLNRPETDDARSIGAAYQTTPAKLQHCPVEGARYNYAPAPAGIMVPFPRKHPFSNIFRRSWIMMTRHQLGFGPLTLTQAAQCKN